MPDLRWDLILPIVERAKKELDEMMKARYLTYCIEDCIVGGKPIHRVAIDGLERCCDARECIYRRNEECTYEKREEG